MTAAHHDCPTCPHCGTRCGFPISAADWNHRANAALHRLACPACGGGWRGTDAEVAQAQRAQTAWEQLEAARAVTP